MLDKFFTWYQKHYLLNLSIAAGLFLLQIFHLYWLFTDVILLKLTGQSYFAFPDIWGVVSTVLEYTEIPAIISTSLLYIHLLRQNFSWKNIFFLLSINVQWLHILWITDEVVIERFTTHTQFLHWPVLIAWLAILIDYLELPVIYDTAKRLLFEIKSRIKKLDPKN
ncbi:MAG: hypothetical protein A3B10_01725 [Candidatus Doudnabacteria bacterium RIFCSPLOWO2_01_FULL_44_21]|uniref:Uncharacterized protein n=1 Tax=Candidatus Doudnabacteria bacterium RIFCSPLOWO2_01_FULL_44_21 TaxID=1817841 RepID=A0A1F5Q2J9_9BACT|nr:MAG: hypothetical protein A3B95_01605 [Candidatus Doudnabacteria bacterium RIFCSPHIGHO2_02_FULL_43_13b]OGE96386.1 MAG: hypothetical protein A3B10_01725 [Candidatus Doudnabacteria bacterium RIFCSPLOWO2_01_FULL_44_21]